VGCGVRGAVFSTPCWVSMFASCIVRARSDVPFFLGIGLIATGVVTLLFGFSTLLWAFALLCALNAFFQGFGSPVCARLLSAWYSRTERGSWWALWNTAHNVGGALIPLVMAAVALLYGSRVAMLLAGLLALGVGMVLFWRLRHRPPPLGLPPVGHCRRPALEVPPPQLRPRAPRIA
ncbi:MFS transporter, partial [Leptospira interrogans serovar Pomona]|nr:MFS transporter [Leptospira interrogans serovar Pomona]